MDEMQQRGSEQLIEELSSRRSLFSKDELQSVLALTEERGVTLDDWHIYGIPAEIDSVAGTFRVEPEAISSVIESLLKNGKLKLEVFPFGIVAPDHYQINVRSKGR